MDNIKEFESQLVQLESFLQKETKGFNDVVADESKPEPETPEQEQAEYTVPSLLSPEMKAGLQVALMQELVQASLWKSLANQMQRLGYFGTQKYFTKESAEELGHYQIIVDFMNDMGDMADVPTIDAPTQVAEEIGDALVIAYNKEVEVYNMYKALYGLSVQDDSVVAQFLLQFLQIQREAVGAYGDLISRYATANKTSEILEFDEYIGEL